MSSGSSVGRHRELVLVLEGELYLIPFALLKGSSSNEYLYERFSLISVPALSHLGAAVKVSPSESIPVYTLNVLCLNSWNGNVCMFSRVTLTVQT